MQIQKCSRLYTAEAQVHRIITHDDQLRLKGSILKNEFDISLPVQAENMIAVVIMISKMVFLILIVLFSLQRYDNLSK